MSGPIIVTTPASPNSSPATRPALSFSSVVAKCATKTVNSGVVALRMAASPLGMWVWPQKMRLNGITLFSSPIGTNIIHAAALAGMVMPVIRASSTSVVAASATRQSATVSGGSSATAILAKKNEPPHSTERMSSSIQSTVEIVSRAGAFMRTACTSARELTTRFAVTFR
jgi:hypothetical protein